MNNDEAKFILQAYRPNGRDAQEPLFTEALAQVACDPGLAQWFAEERALDEAVSRKLSSVAVPADLRGGILAGRKLIRPQTKQWRPAPFLAWAAAAAVFVGVMQFSPLPSQGRTLNAFRGDMTAFVSKKKPVLQFKTQDLSRIREWLASYKVPQGLSVPPGLKGNPTLGCCVLDWKHQRVALICFPDPEGSVSHLLVIDRADFTDLPDLEDPEIVQSGAWTTATWTEGAKLYLLASKRSREDVQHLL